MRSYRFDLKHDGVVVSATRKFPDDIEAMETAQLLSHHYDVEVWDDDEMLIGRFTNSGN